MTEGRGAAPTGAAPFSIPGPRLLRAAALALLLLPPAVTGGCASAGDLAPEELLSQGPVVRELRPGVLMETRRSRGSAEEAEAAADRAEALLAAGDPAGALESVRLALQEMPPAEQGERLRALRMRARREFTRTAIARGEIVPDAARAREGTVLGLRVRLVNLAPVPLTVAAPRSGFSPSLVRLAVTRTARDIFGNVRIDTWEESHPLPPGGASPGGSLDLRIDLDTARFRDAVPHGFLEYRFGGTILPSGLNIGDLELHERIPMEDATVTTFPQKRWEEAAADPSGHMERGLREGNPVRVLVAAACLDPSLRPAAGAALAKRLREGPDPGEVMEGAMRAALRVLAGDREADTWTGERWAALLARGDGEGEGAGTGSAAGEDGP